MINILKYIGDFDKLKDYGFEYYKFNSDEYGFYSHGDESYHTYLVIVEDRTVDFWERDLYEKEHTKNKLADMRIINVKLYDLIKDGLVIEESK